MTSADDDPHHSFPFALRLRTFSAMLNAELVDHPVYERIDLQWFEDRLHGKGMLAFLMRKDGTIDYYAEPGLRLDRSGYEVGAGVHTWRTVAFDHAYLKLTPDGVNAHARFTDAEGRLIEVDICDRNGMPRHPVPFLAPVSAGTMEPPSFLAVWLPQFDLARQLDGEAPRVRIGGELAQLGSIPGAGLHGRLQVKYASPVVAVEINHDDDVLSGSLGDALPVLAPDGGLRALVASSAGHTASLSFSPAFPATLDAAARGRWRLRVDEHLVTGGTWALQPVLESFDLRLRVTRPWRPRHLPPVLRIVTTAMPVFRRWPLTYAWRAAVSPEGAVTAACWSRTAEADELSFPRVLRSSR